MLQLLLAAKRALSRALEWLAIIAMAVLTLVVLWGVFSRYVLRHQTSWTEELATTLMMWVALLGGALAFGEKSHLGLDYFVGKLDPAARRLSDALVYLVVLLFAATAMVYGGILLVQSSLQAGQTLPALGWQRGHVYLAVPISGVFICLYAVEGIIETATRVPRPSTPGAAVPDTSDHQVLGVQPSSPRSVE